MPFKAAGYQTFIIGKWHLSDGKTMPQDKGFDINIGAGKAGSTGTYFAPFNKPNATNPDKLIYGMEDAKPGEYLTDYMSRKTVDYLKSVSTSNKPFFAVCSFYAVHTPIEAKKEVSERYRAKVRKLGLGEDPMKKEEAGVAKTQQDHPVYAANRRVEITVDIDYHETGEHFHEQFCEYTYDLDTICTALEKHGFALESVCDGETFGPLTEDSQRYFFCAVKQYTQLEG